MGSSMVTMWPAVFSLRYFTMAARVVDLPLPVGPVTMTRPRFSRLSLRATGGMRSASKSRISSRTLRITMAHVPRCMYTLTRNRPIPSTS